jgi:hypothetical protein
MNAQASSSADDFRLVDLFSPDESSAAPAARESDARATSRMSGELPESFLFANPLFAPTRDRRDS